MPLSSSRLIRPGILPIFDRPEEVFSEVSASDLRKQLIEAGDSNVKDISDEETSTQEATTTASEDESTTVEETTAE